MSNPETSEPTRRDDSDHICVTCGKVGGACRWVDDAERCMRDQLMSLRAEVAGLRSDAANAPGALKVILGSMAFGASNNGR